MLRIASLRFPARAFPGCALRHRLEHALGESRLLAPAFFSDAVESISKAFPEHFQSMFKSTALCNASPLHHAWLLSIVALSLLRCEALVFASKKPLQRAQAKRLLSAEWTLDRPNCIISYQMKGIIRYNILIYIYVCNYVYTYT